MFIFNGMYWGKWVKNHLFVDKFMENLCRKNSGYQKFR